MARLILSLLLLAMALGQLSDPGGFVDVLETYELGGRAAATPLAVGLIASELVAGIGLLSRRRPAALVAIVVAVAWSFLGAQAFARGLTLDNCGCFGVHLAQPLRWWVLLEDVEFVALAVWVHRRLAAPAEHTDPVTVPVPAESVQ